MALVPLPAEGGGWHFVHPTNIMAVKCAGPRKAEVILSGGVVLKGSEDSHVINKRVEDFVKYLDANPR